MSYTVTAPMALIDCTDGTTRTVMRGGPVPADVTEAHLAHLAAFGIVTEVPDAVEYGGVEPSRFGDDSADVVDVIVAPDVAAAGGRPARAAAKDEWVAYAVSQGAEQDEADALSKADLVATYGG